MLLSQPLQEETQGRWILRGLTDVPGHLLLRLLGQWPPESFSYHRRVMRLNLHCTAMAAASSPGCWAVWPAGMFCIEQWRFSMIGFGRNTVGRAVAVDMLHDFIL